MIAHVYNCLQQVNVLPLLVSVAVLLGEIGRLQPVMLDVSHNAPRLRHLRMLGGDKPPDVTMLPPYLEELTL